MRDSLWSRFEQKMGKVGHRADMYLADFKLINQDAAKILLAFGNHNVGKVTADEIQNWVYQSWGGKLHPLMTTARVHQREGAITLVIEKFRQNRPMTDIQAMTKVASSRAIDRLGEVWEVREAEGERYLSRVMGDDIEALLKERRARMQVRSASVRFDDIRTAGVVKLWAGDMVRFYSNSKVLKGEVVAVAPETVKIKAETGQIVEIPREGVFEVIDRAPQADDAEQSYREDYFTRAFGDRGYAKQLTRD